jgi:hypothetical protein
VRRVLGRRADLLAAHQAAAPLFPDLDVRAVWLQPRLSCEVEPSGRDEEQLLKAPEFKNLIFPNKPQPARLPADGDTKDGKDTKEGKDAKDAKGNAADKGAARDRTAPATRGDARGKTAPATGTPAPK